jgi:hypothetical protein
MSGTNATPRCVTSDVDQCMLHRTISRYWRLMVKSVTKAAAALSFGDLEAAEAIYLCRLHDAIGAAIDAGRITNNRGIELFEAARRRLMQESHRAKQASKPQQKVA